MKGLITENIATKLGIATANANTARESARVGLAEVSKVRFLVRLEVGVGTTFGFKLIEHSAAAAGVSQDLSSDLPHYYRIDGSAGVKVESLKDGVAAIVIAAVDLVAGYVMVEVDHSDLTDGFSHVSIELAAPGAISRDTSCAIEIDSERKPAYELA